METYDTIMELKTNESECMQSLPNKTTDGDCGLLVNTIIEFFVSVSDHLSRLNTNHKVFMVNEEHTISLLIDCLKQYWIQTHDIYIQIRIDNNKQERSKLHIIHFFQLSSKHVCHLGAIMLILQLIKYMSQITKIHSQVFMRTIIQKYTSTVS